MLVVGGEQIKEEKNWLLMPGGILRVAHCGPLHKEEKEIRHLLAHSVANAVIRQATASELWLSAQAPVRDC